MVDQWFCYQTTAGARGSIRAWADNEQLDSQIEFNWPGFSKHPSLYLNDLKSSTSSCFSDKHRITWEQFLALIDGHFPQLAFIVKASPSDSITQTCQSCKAEFQSKQPAKYCSGKCRVKASRLAKKVTPDVTQV